MIELEQYGVPGFLRDYPGMSIAPRMRTELVLRGQLEFRAKAKDGSEIADGYMLEILIPNAFPRALPKVKETGGRIPRNERHHINGNGTLCLGSPLRLLSKINANPTLTGFAEDCLVPYLYAVSHKMTYGGNFVFSELAHGQQGVLDDYRNLLGLTSAEQIMEAIRLLGMKKRLANKQPCPCGCGMRLGACPLRFKLNDFRKMTSRTWFRNHSKNIGSGM